MQSRSIVKPLNIICNSTSRLLMCLVLLPIHLLYLEAFEKTLHRGIVVTIATTTHALHKSIFRQTLMKCKAGVLTASITMEHKPFK